MKHYCHYHPTSLAKWLCESCQIAYDRSCMPDANEKAHAATCPSCKKPLSFIETKITNQPFWEITPQFFRYPLQVEPLLLTILILLLSLSYFSNVITHILGTILSLGLISNYGIQLMLSAAQKEAKNPGLSSIFSGESIHLTANVTLLIGSAIVSVGLAYNFVGIIFSLFVAALWLWVLPALLMITISESSMEQAFQTDQFLSLMLDLKWAYSGLVAYLLIAVLSTLIISDFTQQHLPAIWTPLLITATFCYFSVALFRMFGHAMGQRSSQSSPEKDKAATELAYASSNPTKRIDADIDIALKNGDYSSATLLLEKELKHNSYSDLRRDQLFKLLNALKQHDRLEHFSQLFLRLMLKRGQVTAAAEFIKQLRERNLAYRLYDLELCEELAERFNKAGEHRLVIWLAKDAHIRFDPAPEIADLYLRAAKTLVAKFGQHAKASRYLSHIIDHYPDHPAANSAKILGEHVLSLHSVK